MKKYILLLLIAFLSVHLLAQDKNQFNPVNTGVNSLGIAPDSRGGGMGDVGAATDPDVNSQYWNPAKYPFTISCVRFYPFLIINITHITIVLELSASLFYIYFYKSYI